jgi:NADH-quinone oxidoreductase subunit L
MHVVATLGALTALFAACCALVQNDLKRVLAYSTMSQLGYMFLAVGVGAYGAAIFHLVTHAFFKALLFLTAGIVIHTAHGEQDMRRLGGLAKDIPYTAFMFAVGGAALAGVPLTAGSFSKEAILHATHHSHDGYLLFLVGAAVAVLTAFYTFRAFFMTFYGPRKVEHPHLPGGPTVLSCTVLTVLSLIAGFFHSHLSSFLGRMDWVENRMQSETAGLETESLVRFQIEPGLLSPSAISLSVLVLVAIFAAYVLYGGSKPDKLGRNTTMLNFARGGFGIDAGFGALADGFQLIARLIARGVDQLFTGFIPDILGQSFMSMGKLLRGTQTGQIRHYMVSIMISVMVLLVYSLFIGGGFLL